MRASTSCGHARFSSGSLSVRSWAREATRAGVETLRHVRVYPWAERDQPPEMNYVDASGKPFDTIHPTDARYFDDLAAMIDYEHDDAVDPEVAASLTQIGIIKGSPFAPDERMRAIFDEAARVGSVMAFALCNSPRDDYLRYPDRQWSDDVTGYPTFRDHNGRPLVDAMVRMAWFATGRASAMGHPQPGTGSAYTWTYRDGNGNWLDPRRTYRLRLPAPVPAKNFWSVVVYDLWTRSMLANGQQFPSLSSYGDGIRTNDDGSTDVYIGPEPPDGLRAQLDPHPARHRLVPDPPPLRADSNRGSTKPGDPTTLKPSGRRPSPSPDPRLTR